MRVRLGEITPYTIRYTIYLSVIIVQTEINRNPEVQEPPVPQPDRTDILQLDHPDQDQR